MASGVPNVVVELVRVMEHPLPKMVPFTVKVVIAPFETTNDTATF
jgi:hypothetical protein